MTFKVVVHPDEEKGGFWAEVPALPGCMSQGETMAELELNIRDAIEGWLLAGETGVEENDSLLAIAV